MVILTVDVPIQAIPHGLKDGPQLRRSSTRRHLQSQVTDAADEPRLGRRHVDSQMENGGLMGLP